MKNLLIFILVIYAANCKAQFHFKLDYTYFGVSFYPTKCVDTLNFKIEKGEFINCYAKIYLEDCNGQSRFIISDKKKVIRITGFYANASDTLVRYSNAKIMGKPKGHSYYRVGVLRYLSPLETGTWVFYNKQGRETSRTEYHIERWKPN